MSGWGNDEENVLAQGGEEGAEDEEDDRVAVVFLRSEVDLGRDVRSHGYIFIYLLNEIHI